MSCSSTTANSRSRPGKRQPREGEGRQRAQHELRRQDQRDQHHGVEQIARERRRLPGGLEVVPASAARTDRNAWRRPPDGTRSTPRRAAAAATECRASRRRWSPALRPIGLWSATIIGSAPAGRARRTATQPASARIASSTTVSVAAVGGVPEAEAGFVDVVQQQRGGVVRPAARHHHDMVDHAERVDHRVDQHEQRGRHQQRQGDAAEDSSSATNLPAPPPRADRSAWSATRRGRRS